MSVSNIAQVQSSPAAVDNQRSADLPQVSGLADGTSDLVGMLPALPGTVPTLQPNGHVAKGAKEVAPPPPRRKDRFDKSDIAKLVDAVQSGDTNATPEALRALQRAAEQEMYGQQVLHPSLSLHHEFQALMLAVQSNNAPAAQQALARLQASMHGTT